MEQDLQMEDLEEEDFDVPINPSHKKEVLVLVRKTQEDKVKEETLVK
jgi:hypothetical protein